jgi:hypothetical protein
MPTMPQYGTIIAAGDTPVADLLMADLQQIRTFLNSTKLDYVNIQTGGLATANYADLSVTGAKIADGTVTSAKTNLTLLSDVLAASIIPLPGTVTDLCSVTVVNGAKYLVIATVDFGGVDGNVRAFLTYNGADQLQVDFFTTGSETEDDITPLIAAATITSGTTIKLRAQKVNGSPSVLAGATRLIALRVG